MLFETIVGSIFVLWAFLFVVSSDWRTILKTSLLLALLAFCIWGIIVIGGSLFAGR